MTIGGWKNICAYMKEMNEYKVLEQLDSWKFISIQFTC